MKKKILLQAKNVAVKLGDREILHELSLAVGGGEFIGIVGPNGAGKSTFLRSLRGFQKLSQGEVRLNGQSINRQNSKVLARTVAYLQQEINTGFGMKAIDTVLAGRYPYLSWWRNESQEDYKIAKECMNFTGVAELAEQPLQQVSGGERQRILLAKVLAQQTPLIFLDEPTASLDLVYQEEIFRYCQTLCREGKTVLLIAHDLKLAAKFCSRLLLLADGRIVADGTAKEVITPVNLEAAYGLHAAVFMNAITGHLDIHTYASAAETEIQRTGRLKVHVIGGGGSAATLFRALYEAAYQISGGVFQQGDTDAEVCRAFSGDCLAGAAFSAITPELAAEHRLKIAAADWTVLSNLPVGSQNMDNLQAAATAKKLFIINDNDICERDFTENGQATLLYRQLIKLPQTMVLKEEEFLQLIAAGGQKVS